MRFGRFFFILLLVFQPVFAADPTVRPIFLDNLDEEEQTTPKVVPRNIPNPAQDNLDAVLENLNGDEIIELNTKNNTKFTAIFKQALAKEPNGSVLILPGDGLYPTRLKSIINQMTSVGWDSLSLSLPYYPRFEIIEERQIPPVKIHAKQPKKKDDEKDKKADSSSKTGLALDEDFQGKAADLDPPPANTANLNASFEDEEQQTPKALLTKKTPIIEVQKKYAQKIKNRFESGMANLNSKRQNEWISLILHRENAYWLTDNLSKNLLPNSVPIVFLNTVVPKAYDENSLSKSIIDLGRRPILDIYNPKNNQEAKLAKLRFAAYKRAGNDLAIQVKEYSKATTNPKYINNWTAQRISGWIRSLKKQHPKIKYGILSQQK